MRKSSGFTLIELMVTIGILMVVMALLTYPILSAYGYIRKAQTKTDAKIAAEAAIQRMKNDISQAAYIFDIVPDGSQVTVLPSSDGNPLDSDGKVKLIRYMQVLDFPWKSGASSWTLLNPEYSGQNPAFSSYYNPFWQPTGGQMNTYILTRFESERLPWLNVAEQDAFHFGVDGLYPIYTWPTKNGAQPILQEQLQRQFRNVMVSVTPLGAKSDVPQFQVTPMRQETETLTMMTDQSGRKIPTVAIARYPMWGGRNYDFDSLRAAGSLDLALAMYGLTGDDNTFNDLYYFDILDTKTNGDGIVVPSIRRLYPAGTNPFGFQVRVYDSFGNLYYGVTKDINGDPTILLQRHFMDWPPIDRPDWDDAHPLWTKADVERQRLEGKVVFAQPIAVNSLTLTAPSGNISTSTLPIPSGGSWSDATAYLADLPNKITLQNGQTITFRRVANEADLTEGTFYVPTFGKYYDYQSREIQFKSSRLSEGTWDIVEKVNGIWETTSLIYTICDLQPSDMVVATYSTKGVLDILLTVSRQDSTSRIQRQQRSDYTAKFRIKAENAIVQARSGR